jgi:iron(II)-dependent oxidoreductase
VDLTTRVTEGLDAARRRTLGLLEPFDDDALARQVSPLMSPLVWDLAHIGHFEELWLLREISGAPPTDPRFDDIDDAFKHPRRERSALEILGPSDAQAFVADVRRRALDHLATVDFDGTDPLLEHAFVYGMVIQHEHQHDETLLATINLMDDPRLLESPTTEALAPGAVRSSGAFVDVAGGDVKIGTSIEPWAYDNERPEHVASVAPFRIGATPVTNAEHAGFIADGGYDDERLWTPAGWAWRQEAELTHPQGWHTEGNGDWSRTRFGRHEPVPGDEPVQHVCWYEADAHARWAGARLATEHEWECAASAGALAGSGEVWEWTSSDFGAYPGFRAFPYREYSEVFFGDEYKVLRGGSWATDSSVLRRTFRNWDYPIRRQIFSGVRLAADA